MTLYEIWYHDEWRSTDTYQRQAILSSIEDTTNWLLSHKDHWYDNETPIDDVVDRAINQKFTYNANTVIKELETFNQMIYVAVNKLTKRNNK